MNARNNVVLLVSAFALTLAGCASTGKDSMSGSDAAASTTANADMISEQQRKISMLESELRNKERELAIAASNRESTQTTTMSSTSMSASADLFPPNPRPGECYARVIIPAKYNTTTKRVLKREASERIEIIPAKYAPSTERILVKPASTRLVEVPAEYKTVSERVLDKPAYTEWKRSTGKGVGIGSASGSGGAAAQIERFGDQKVVATRVEDTGEVMCLVEVPATYKTVNKTVLVKPATVREIEIPAEYKTIETMKLVQPASERRIAIPEEYDTVTLTEKVTDEELQWRPVLCEVNMTAQNVSALQASLQKTGCCKCGPNRNECRVDGVIGPCTLQAAQCYANQKGLPSGEKYVTMEIIRSLGLKF